MQNIPIRGVRLPHKLCGALLFLSAAASVQAQPAGSLGENFLYRVQKGDTLIALAQTYARDGAAWRQLQALNQVDDPYRMPIGLVLRIPLALIPREAAQARLTLIRGPVHTDNTPARTGETLGPGNTLSTRDNGYATVELEDGTLITLPPNTTLQLNQINKFQGTNLTDTVIEMSHGSLEATVAPAGGGVGRFEVRTPVAITGVRGTHLLLKNAVEGQTNSVTSGSVRLQPRPDGGRPDAPTLLEQGYGSVVRADGTLAGHWPLLPAPTVTEPQRQGGVWVAHITPVSDAIAYEIIVSHDAQGHLRVSSSETRNSELRVATPGSGAYHLTVRAIDVRGLRGLATRLAVLGSNVLIDSRGNAILSGTGDSILLTDY